ncbi:2-keto-4-pentenoate hydratase [Variovorax sp. OV329]|uniref:2-keto-4-pentenoate hydratase n=1 Tax=Variovorax sp. OV329 TaxID=1882825 RepID=UPI0008EDBA1F|nr:hydratase [Variovorax sp. OV329]SFM75269.1 2-oxo-3-hexenedioate decarboxylase [Variovorax sp. OV329]
MTITPETLLAHGDEGTLWPADARDASNWPDLEVAYRDALEVRALREKRGEKPVGFKIGFTNRTIWERYGVFAPIWGTVWDSTLTRGGAEGELSLARLSQPRLEPEVVFGIRATPSRSPTLEGLFECIDWLAPGFEVVQSHCEAWKFSAPETVADSGLHGRLLVGRQTPVRDLADSGEALDKLLAACRVRLMQGDQRKDEGQGANVLDGPLHALLYFVEELQQNPGAPELKPGDLVTTGTWTDAWPVEPGQQWRADFDAPIPSLAVRFV